MESAGLDLVDNESILQGRQRNGNSPLESSSAQLPGVPDKMTDEEAGAQKVKAIAVHTILFMYAVCIYIYILGLSYCL